MIREALLEPLYARYLKMQCGHIPRHIAIIQDGNRRYARAIGITTSDGHRAGAEKTEEMLDWAHELGIRHITLYTFSTENFSRDDEEVGQLFALFKEKFIRILTDERVHKYRIRVQMVGDRALLPPDLLEAVSAAEEATKNYDGFCLNIALAYGGRNEIVLAARDILSSVQDGIIRPDAIDVKMVESHLHGGRGLPPVDPSYGRETIIARQIFYHGLQTATNPQFISVHPTGRFSGRLTFSGLSAFMTSG